MYLCNKLKSGTVKPTNLFFLKIVLPVRGDYIVSEEKAHLPSDIEPFTRASSSQSKADLSPEKPLERLSRCFQI